MKLIDYIYTKGLFKLRAARIAYRGSGAAAAGKMEATSISLSTKKIISCTCPLLKVHYILDILMELHISWDFLNIF